MKKIKIVSLAAAALFSSALFADAFEFVTMENGASYIQINEDLESFSFRSDFKSIGNSGNVGYVIYPNGLSGDDMKEYLRENAGNAQFGKKLTGGNVDLGSLNAGDRVGFFLERKNGDVIYDTSFEEFHGKDYIAFDKNGGHGKDEWMSIEGIETSGGGSGTPNGAPLPGALAALLVGFVGIGAWKAGNKKKSS